MKKLLAVSAITLLSFMVAHADEPQAPSTDYVDVVAHISKTMRAYHYNPAELETPGYKRVEAAVAALAETAGSDEAFIAGFREIWKDGPFSHVELNPARGTADDLAAYLDNLRIGGGGAVLTWRGDDAILTVNTMMGLDTIEEIDAAYATIAEKGADSLIIDLRENGGGAFAVRPLVGHVIDQQFDAGGFVSQRWNAENHHAPTASDLKTVEPWEGWSIRAFWADVQEQPLTRLRFTPVEPVFEGPVYVLTSQRTASAAELAADALKISGRAVLIGETTAGEMLSQKIYDVPGGFHLSLPIADYYSAENGRIEGVGVAPDIETDAAMDTALSQ
jgi:carboxyl-terminal processing protease